MKFVTLVLTVFLLFYFSYATLSPNSGKDEKKKNKKAKDKIKGGKEKVFFSDNENQSVLTSKTKESLYFK